MLTDRDGQGAACSPSQALTPMSERLRRGFSLRPGNLDGRLICSAWVGDHAHTLGLSEAYSLRTTVSNSLAFIIS